jgi:hypothetical protein
MLPADKQSDPSIERLLGEFELRRPRALPHVASSAPRWRRLAAAASVLAACGVSAWLLRTPVETRQSTPASAVAAEGLERYQRASSLALTRLALGDPSRFEAELSEASRKSLPNFQQRDSALQVLTKE